MSSPTSLVPGQEVDHYRILGQLGQGGMGAVYLAEDLKLQRKVALKLLLAAHSNDREHIRRFAQESRAATALSHPNIVTIFEVGEFPAGHYLVMEYVEGPTLRQALRDAHQLDLAYALDIAVQVGNALVAAHQAGVIHRDIKPENIVLRPDGYVKVLDFGLAKLTERQRDRERERRGEDDPTLALSLHPSVSLSQTNPGTVMGTLSYMSPEQTRGQRLDARTDIFSLGVVLFEMVTGQVPFQGETPSDVMAAILRAEPPSVHGFKADLPAALQSIIETALSKERASRYQTAAAMVQALRKVKQRVEWEREHDEPYHSAETSPSGASPTPSSAEYLVNQIRRHRRAATVGGVLLLLLAAVVAYALWSRPHRELDSVAILPFINASADPNYEYLSDGIADSIINRLAQLSELKVLSLNAVARYRGQTVDAQTVGQELQVRTVLTGHMQQQGDQLTINAELVDTHDRRRLWGHQYQRRIADLLTVEEEIARELSAQLRPQLSQTEQQRISRRATDNPAAYQLYLKGRHQWNKRSGVSLNAAVGFFNQAIELDPGYALAWAGLADCYGLLSNYTNLSPTETMPRARAAAQKALQFDEALPEAHTALGLVKRDYEWDFAGAEQSFRRALALNPSYATAWQFQAENFVWLKKFEEALTAMKRAQELDPFSLIINGEVGWVYLQAGRYDEAVAQLRKTVALDPQFARSYFFLGRAYEQQRNYPEAMAATTRALELSHGFTFFLASLGHIYGVSGQTAQARQIQTQLQERAKQEYVSPMAFAVVAAGLGQRDQAFAALEQAWINHDPILVSYLHDPQLANLQNDPRFQALEQRLKPTR